MRTRIVLALLAAALLAPAGLAGADPPQPSPTNCHTVIHNAANTFRITHVAVRYGECDTARHVGRLYLHATDCHSKQYCLIANSWSCKTTLSRDGYHYADCTELHYRSEVFLSWHRVRH
jgi:hypothetical protein